MNKTNVFSILFLFILISGACTRKQSETTSTDTTRTSTSVPAVILLDTTGYVKGYETHTYTLPVKKQGAYQVTASSENPGIIFVIQDAEGNDVTGETYPSWSGELKKADYKLIIGLTRNAARKNSKAASYTIQVNRQP